MATFLSDELLFLKNHKNTEIKSMMINFLRSTLLVLAAGFLGHAQAQINTAEIEAINVAARVLFSGISSTEQFGNNFTQVFSSACAQNFCSDRQMCQYMALGARYPIDCSNLSDQPFKQDPHDAAIKSILSALPGPSSCNNLALSMTPGQLLITEDGSLPRAINSCLEDQERIETSILNNKVEVLRRLGFFESFGGRTLAQEHEGCSFPYAQSNNCHAAASRFVKKNGLGNAAKAQEIGKNSFGIAAFQADYIATIGMSELRSHHSGCNFPHAQSNECVSAIHRACQARGFSAGIAQETGDQSYGVACLHAGWYGDISMSELVGHHAGCRFPQAQSNDCVAAIHRACKQRGFGAGFAQEIGNQVYGVACIQPSWFGDVRVR
jgi:hypothetical protein